MLNKFLFYTCIFGIVIAAGVIGISVTMILQNGNNTGHLTEIQKLFTYILCIAIAFIAFMVFLLPKK
jgi:hypothetical protein